MNLDRNGMSKQRNDHVVAATPCQKSRVGFIKFKRCTIDKLNLVLGIKCSDHGSTTLVVNGRS